MHDDASIKTKEVKVVDICNKSRSFLKSVPRIFYFESPNGIAECVDLCK